MNREAHIAESIVAGYSYAVDTMDIVVEGWKPFNVDMIREINAVYFDFKDDEGEDREDGRFRIISHQTLCRPMGWQQEQDMKKKGLAPTTKIWGQIPQGSGDAAFNALSTMLKKKFEAEK